MLRSSVARLLLAQLGPAPGSAAWALPAACSCQPSQRLAMSTSAGSSGGASSEQEGQAPKPETFSSPASASGDGSSPSTSASTRRLLDLFEKGSSSEPGPSAGGMEGPPSSRGRRRRAQEAAVPVVEQPMGDMDASMAAEASLQQLADQHAVALVLQAVENCKPLMKVKSFKKGTKVVNVPRVVPLNEQRSLSVRWILEAAGKRRDSAAPGKRLSLAECVAIELILASQKKGAAREKRDALHALATENKANLQGVAG